MSTLPSNLKTDGRTWPLHAGQLAAMVEQINQMSAGKNVVILERTPQLNGRITSVTFKIPAGAISVELHEGALFVCGEDPEADGDTAYWETFAPGTNYKVDPETNTVTLCRRNGAVTTLTFTD